MISSYVGENAEFERQYLSGELEVELTPQGTLAEKCRAGGAGIPAFYTATGVGTLVETGGFPIKYKLNSKEVEIESDEKPKANFDGRDYILERSIVGDFALIKAYKADKMGNLQFNKTARNFNADMATAGKIVVAQVEEIVENGELDPDQIHVPAIFVDRIFRPETTDKIIEKVVYRQEEGSQQGEKKPSQILREKIVQRLTQEVSDGMYVNLGIGIPTLLPSMLDKNVRIEL